MNILNKIGTCPLPLRSVGNLQYPPHWREYEDCKQILKLSLNPTHTYNARQDFSQHSRQKTCPMGRAESDYCLSASASSSIKPKILNTKTARRLTPSDRNGAYNTNYLASTSCFSAVHLLLYPCICFLHC